MEQQTKLPTGKGRESTMCAVHSAECEQRREGGMLDRPIVRHVDTIRERRVELFELEGVGRNTPSVSVLLRKVVWTRLAIDIVSFIFFFQCTPRR